MTRLKKSLSHPSWQGVQGVLSLIALIVTCIVGYLTLSAGKPRLTITEFSCIASVTDDARIDFTLDGAKLSRFISTNFQLALSGTEPVLVNAFNEPITVTVPNEYKIVAIIPNEDSPKTDWKKQSDQRWELIPQVINVGVPLELKVIVTDAVDLPKTQLGEKRKFTRNLKFAWRAYITGLSRPQFQKYSLEFDEDGSRSGFIFGVFPFGFFVFTGIYFWLFFVLLVLLTISSCLLVRRQRPSTSAGALLGFSAIHTTLGILSAEIVVNFATLGFRLTGWFCYPVLLAYCVFSTFLVFRSSRRRRSRSSLGTSGSNDSTNTGQTGGAH